MTDDLIARLLAFEGSDELGNGDFSLMQEAAEALEAARESTCVSLLADIRWACGDKGARMQPELVEFIRELAADSERLDWLEGEASPGIRLHNGDFRSDKHVGLGLANTGRTLRQAIDDARGEARNG